MITIDICKKLKANAAIKNIVADRVGVGFLEAVANDAHIICTLTDAKPSRDNTQDFDLWHATLEIACCAASAAIAADLADKVYELFKSSEILSDKIKSLELQTSYQAPSLDDINTLFAQVQVYKIKFRKG